MSTIEYRFLEPLDVLLLRGNKLFGDPGSYGEALMPPWPSVAAGAIRSRMLADENVNFTAFAHGLAPHPSLGSPQAPGPFKINAFHLARRGQNGTLEALMPLPADLSVIADEQGQLRVGRRIPTATTAGLLSSSPLPLLPVLAETQRDKPVAGYWLRESGWKKYLHGQPPCIPDLVHCDDLWLLDYRVGVGLDSATRSAAEGHLFSAQAVAMKPGVGFLVGITGAQPPNTGSVRLGGDGRAAAISSAAVQLAEPDFTALAQAGCCRLILTSPGLFVGGWPLPGMNDEGHIQWGEISARVVCAAVPRAEVISGWDLAKNQGKGGPKPAQRAAPTGSVYWLDQLQASPTTLRQLVNDGLWGTPCPDPARRAEGFNRITLAAF